MDSDGPCNRLLMPVRMCQHVLGCYVMLMEAEGLRTPPPIVVAVIYNGDQPWDVQTQLSELSFGFDRCVLLDEKGLHERGELPAGNLFRPPLAALHAGDIGEFAAPDRSELAEVVRQHEGEPMRATSADFEQHEAAARPAVAVCDLMFTLLRVDSVEDFEQR